MMTVLSVLIILNYLFLLLGGVSALLLSVSFSRTQRARFPSLRRLDGRQLGLTIVTAVLLFFGYAAYAFKEVALLRLAFRVAPGPGTSQVIQATETGIDLEFRDAAAQRVNTARESFRIGQAHFSAGRYREAADDYQRSIQALPTLSAVLNRGLSLRYLPDYPAAEGVLRGGLQLASEQHREQFEAHFSLYLSSVLGSQGKTSEAEPFVKKALTIYERIGDDLGQANAHLNIGAILRVRGDYTGAVNEWRMALKGFSRADNALGQANVNNNLAIVYLARMELTDAATAYGAALEGYEKLDNHTGIARTSIDLARVYMDQGRLAEALTLSQRAFDQANGLNNNALRCAALNTIGSVRDEQGRFDDAVAVELIALKLVESSNEETFGHYLLAESYRRLGRLRDAHDQATSAIESGRRNGEPIVLSLGPIALGFVYLSEHRFAEAEDAFQKGLAIADANALPGNQALAWAGLGMAEAALGHSERALQLLLLAHKTFSSAGVKVRVALETQQLIARLQSEQNVSRR